MCIYIYIYTHGIYTMLFSFSSLAILLLFSLFRPWFLSLAQVMLESGKFDGIICDLWAPIHGPWGALAGLHIVQSCG